MRILAKHQGGMPLELNDLTDQLQGGTLDAVSGLASPFVDSDGNCILAGCEVVGTNASNGWVMLSGALYFFPAQAIPAGNLDNVAIVTDIQYDPEGLDNFADGNAKDTYELRYATLQMAAGTVNSPNLSLLSGRRPSTWVGEIYKSFEPLTLAVARSQVRTVATQDLAGILINGWASPYAGACVSRRMDSTNVAYLNLELQVDAATDIEAGILPQGYRPVTRVNRVIVIGDISAPEYGILDIYDDGRLFVRLAAVSASVGRVHINESYLSY